MRKSGHDLSRLNDEVVACEKCPRLVEFRRAIARSKKKRFSDWDYWGRPVPGFGDPDASLLIVGLAPAPHGGNRTGRVFTGDRSGDFLIRALFRAGFASQPVSESRSDGLMLKGVYLTAAVKCAPPGDRPLPMEVRKCSPFLERELAILRGLRAIVCLGQIAYRAMFVTVETRYGLNVSMPAFRHGLELDLGRGLPWLFASYHPSPRNTQTGKLTEQMFMTLLYQIKNRLEARS